MRYALILWTSTRAIGLTGICLCTAALLQGTDQIALETPRHQARGSKTFAFRHSPKYKIRCCNIRVRLRLLRLVLYVSLQAVNMAQQSLAKDLFEDMGRKVAEASARNDDVDGTKVVDEIPETLCMNCHSENVSHRLDREGLILTVPQASTRLLLTKIPFFREIVIMSSACPECGWKNAEVQPAGEIQQRGVKITLKIDGAEDLSRQIVKSDTAVFRVEDIDLEIPPGRGQLTNVEGVLSMVAEDLAQKQDERKQAMPEVYEKIQVIVGTLQEMAAGNKTPFKITVDDPAGNSSIEPSMHDTSAKYFRHEYPRSAEQNAALGLGDSEGTQAPPTEIRPEYHADQMYPRMPQGPMVNNVDEEDIVENQVYSFPASCPGCTKPCTTNMKMVNIPHFKQVVLMSTVCEHCGCKSQLTPIYKPQLTDYRQKQ